MSPSVVVVAPLKLERIRPVGFNIREESFIWLKATSCNKSVALLGYTRTLITTQIVLFHTLNNSDFEHFFSRSNQPN